MRKRTMNFLMSTATMMAFSGLALACPPECEEDGGSDGDKQARTSVWHGEMSDNGEAAIQWISHDEAIHDLFNEGDEHVEIMVFSDGKTLKVMRNGQEVPAESLNELGNQFHFFGDHEAGGAFEIKMEPGAAEIPSIGTMWTTDDTIPHVIKSDMVKQPPVMLGITMGEPDEALRAHLGLGDRSVIMVDSVIEGLPASKAGLRKYDIIVGLDGSDDHVTAARLHDILLAKKPGDELMLRVLRGGEKETYRVELRAYSPKDLGITEEHDPISNLFIKPERAHASQAQHANQLSELLEQLRESGFKPEQIETVQRLIESAKAQANKAMGDRQLVWERENGPMADSPRPPSKAVVPAPDGRRMIEIEVPDLRNFQVPDALRGRIEQFGGAHSDDLERRLNELESRMDEVSARMEERLERVITRFEELTNRLERRLRDGG